MEEKVLSSAKKQLNKDPTTLALENFHMLKIFDRLKVFLEENGKEIRSLSLAGCKLQTIEALPFLSKLTSLNLSDNQLPDAQILHLSNYKTLKYLYLAGNKIQQIPTLIQLNGNSGLKVLDCYMCSVSSKPNYRETMFSTFPKLFLLDYLNQNNEEVSFAESSEYESEEEENEGLEDFISNEANPENEEAIEGDAQIQNNEDEEDSEESSYSESDESALNSEEKDGKIEKEELTSNTDQKMLKIDHDSSNNLDNSPKNSINHNLIGKKTEPSSVLDDVKILKKIQN